MIQKIRCWLRWHSWEQRINQEVGGPGGGYLICRHCGKEKPGYGPPIAGSIG